MCACLRLGSVISRLACANKGEENLPPRARPLPRATLAPHPPARPAAPPLGRRARPSHPPVDECLRQEVDAKIILLSLARLLRPPELLLAARRGHRRGGARGAVWRVGLGGPTLRLVSCDGRLWRGLLLDQLAVGREGCGRESLWTRPAHLGIENRPQARATVSGADGGGEVETLEV